MAELLDSIPALRDLAPAHRTLIAGCARLRVYKPGDALLREGGPADEFFVVREGSVAVETHVPGRGPVTVETLHAGDVLGWSWLLPPYRSAFGARALERARVIALDGACLRAKCDADPELGYALLKLLTALFTERLQDTRLRLLDLYAKPGNG